MKYVLTISIVCFAFNLHGQSGLFGRKNSLGLKIEVNPTLGYTSKDFGDISVKKIRWLTYEYSFDYSRILRDNLELAVAYKGTTGGAYSSGFSIYNRYWPSNAAWYYHDINLSIRKYIKNYIAPSGVYYAFGLSLPFAKLNSAPSANLISKNITETVFLDATGYEMKETTYYTFTFDQEIPDRKIILGLGLQLGVGTTFILMYLQR